MQLKVKVEHWCTDSSVWYIYEIAHILKAKKGNSENIVGLRNAAHDRIERIMNSAHWAQGILNNAKDTVGCSSTSTARLWEIEGLVWAALRLP